MNKYNEEFKHALSGEYRINIKRLFERSNELCKKSFASMVQALFVLFFVMVIVSMLFIEALDIQTLEDFETLEQSQSSLINITLTLILAPLITGIIMMGVNNARGQSTRVSNIFSFLSLSVLLAIASLLTSVLITIGMALFILPGLYLYLTTKFTLPLIADRGLRPIAAMVLSVKILHRHALHILLIMLVFVMLMLLVFITLGLAFIWVGPLYFNLFGLLYEDIVGHRKSATDEDLSPTQAINQKGEDTHFDA